MNVDLDRKGRIFMNRKAIPISEAELPIMRVLWQYGSLSSPEIFAHLEGNRSTLKTLLQRLVAKGAVEAQELTSRSYLYSAKVSRESYIAQERKGFLQRAFDGSVQQLLLNFVKEEKVTREDLQRLLEEIDKEDDA